MRGAELRRRRSIGLLPIDTDVEAKGHIYVLRWNFLGGNRVASKIRRADSIHGSGESFFSIAARMRGPIQAFHHITALWIIALS